MKNLNINDYCIDMDSIIDLDEQKRTIILDLYQQLLHSVDDSLKSLEIRFNTLRYNGYLKRVSHIERSEKLKKILDKDNDGK